MKNSLLSVWKWIEQSAKLVVTKILALFGVNITEESWQGFIQFVKFGLVGVSNTIISYIVYVVIVWAGWHYMLGQVVGFVISVLNSFFWNNKYVFKKEEGTDRSFLQALIKTFIAYGVTGLLLSTVLLYLWIDLFQISKYIAPILNLLITIPLNFVVNKFWAFKSKKKLYKTIKEKKQL